MRLLAAALGCVLWIGRLNAAEPALSGGFEHFYNLEYPQAIAWFETDLRRDVNDPERWNHLAQALLYSEMFRAGALESELVSGSNPFFRRERVQPSAAVEKRFDECLNRSMSIAQARLDKDANSTSAMYALSVAHGLRANYNFLVRKAWMDALRDATAARKLNSRIVEINPSDIDSRLVLGVHDYILGSLSWHVKMLGFLAGFHGDREEGIRTLQLVARNGVQNKFDAQVLLAAIYRRERRPLEALPLLKNVAQRFPRNFLFRLEMVQMYSDAGDKDSAMTVLNEVEALKVANSPGIAMLPIEKIWYYRGNLLFWYREYDAAIAILKKVTPNAAVLDGHTAVMAWMRLGQSMDMKDRRKEAETAYREAVRLGADTEPGRESRGYLNSRYRRKEDA